MNIKEQSGYSKDEDITCVNVSGADSEKFLQGQFSNDVTHITDKSYQYSSYSTNQGKVIAIFRILKSEDGYLLLIDKSIVQYFIEKLSMYILMSKVKIQELDEYEVYGICGKEAKKILSGNSMKENQYLQDKNNIVINNNNKYLSAAILISKNNVDNNIEKYIKSCEILNFNVNELIDNLLMLPRITMETKETHIPQVLNLEELKGINYQKGCYTGQEIVARTHYLGKIKKKVFLLSHDNIYLDVGDKIHNSDGEIVGEVFTSTQKIDDACLSIGIIKLDAVANEISSGVTKLNLF